MKKRFLLLLLFISFFTWKNVSAVEIGVSNSEGYDGVSFLEDAALTMRSGADSTLVIQYGPDYQDNSEIDKIVINLTPGSSIASVSSSIDSEGDTITGSGNSYTILISSEAKTGTALIKLHLSEVSSFTETNLSATAESYAGNTKVSSSTLSVKYNILVKEKNCDASYGVLVNTNQGEPEKVGELIGEMYALKVNSDSLTVTLTPENAKEKIYFAAGGLLGDQFELLPDGKYTANIGYGDTELGFLIHSECSDKWQTISSKIMGAMLIGVSLEDYQYHPNYVSLTITREDNRSDVNTLNSLSISDAKISFSPSVKTYNVTVPNKVKTVKITSTLTHKKSSYVSGYGNRTVNLSEGSNEVLVKVQAENGDIETYTIIIKREANDNAYLQKLTVNGEEIKLKEGTLIYSITVDNNITSVEIKADPVDEKAKVEIGKTDNLKEGSNKIMITVTSQSDTKNVYVINVVRDKLISTNSKLKAITIKGYPLDFYPDIKEYTLTIKRKEKSLDIDVDLDNNKADYNITGNENLKDGSIIKIKVLAEDGKSSTTYLLHIKQEKSKIGILLLIIGLLLAAAVLLFFVLRKKKKKPIPVPVEEKEEEKPVVEVPKEENDDEQEEPEEDPPVEEPPLEPAAAIQLEEEKPMIYDLEEQARLQEENG